MRIAITGASGFLGQHVLAAMAQLRANTLLDIDVVATARVLRSSLPQYPGVRWVSLDLAAPPGDPFASLGKPDVVVHLAWEGLPNYHSPQHISTELPRHQRFLKRLARNGKPGLLVAGTCAEYGRQDGCLSEDSPARPEHPYAAAKDALRRKLEYISAATGCGLTWLRIFYLFGTGQPERTLFSQLMRAIARGDTVFNMSVGDQVRDYLPVTNAAVAIVSLALRLGRGLSGDGIVNLASGQPCSVRSLVEQWARNSPIRLNCGAVPYLSHEQKRFWGSTSKLRSLIGSNFIGRESNQGSL